MRSNISMLALKAAGLLLIIYGLLFATFIVTKTGFADLWRPPVNGLFCYIATMGFLIWLGRNFDRLWPVNSNTNKTQQPFHKLGLITAASVVGISVIVNVLIIAAVLLFENTTKIDYPLQPMFTFFLSGLWFLYVMYALAGLVSSSGSETRTLANFGKYSIIGAIALSIYFLLPFKWFGDASVRAFGLITGMDISNLSFDYAGKPNDTVNWLQTTAIPSLISIGFGFITAYVTSVTWYEYFKKMNDAGIKEAEPSRKGRDPNFDDLWFGRIEDATTNVRLSGVTLGGWFKNWPRLKKSIEIALAKESFNCICFTFSDPGADFFWIRRNDEAKNQAVPGEDTVVRFSQAIERIYYMLARPGDDAIVKDTRSFMNTNFAGDFDDSKLDAFFNQFVSEHKERLNKFLADDSNQKFITLLRSESNKDRWKVCFNKGMMVGATLFDDRIFFVPYLPYVKDKDCPQYLIRTNSPLGTSLFRSIESLTSDKGSAVRVQSQAELIGIAFRMWSSCNKNKGDLFSYSEIPFWLRSNLT